MLSIPVTSKTITRHGSTFFTATSVEMNGRRPSMEDHSSIAIHEVTGAGYFGVFDGHGGNQASLFCKNNVVSTLMEQKDCADDTIETVFQSLDKLFCQNTAMDNEGSTCLCAIVTPSVVKAKPTKEKPQEQQIKYSIVVANAGDCKAVFLRKKDKKAFPLSVDHKPHVKEERQRIEKAGGILYDNRVDGDLNVSRNMGDGRFKDNVNLPWDKQKVISKPSIQKMSGVSGDMVIFWLFLDYSFKPFVFGSYFLDVMGCLKP